MSSAHPYQKFDYAFNETPSQDFAEITEDERSEALQRLTLLADDAKDDLE